MAEENISQAFRLKNVDETRNYLSQDELMSKKHKKVCATLNYIAHFLILGSTITGICFHFLICFFLYSIKNKVPSISDFVKKTDYNTKHY